MAAVGAPRPVYDGITSVLIRCSDFPRFTLAKRNLKVETDGETIRWFLDHHPELTRVPDPAAEIVLVPTPAVPRKAPGRCTGGRLLPASYGKRRKLVQCRKRPDHVDEGDPDHSWWARSTKPFTWRDQ
jgi:hypothetical protein